jgi:hypothetical protein
MASWFETRGVAALLTMRIYEEAPPGPRHAQPDHKLRAVSKDETMRTTLQ